MALDLLRREASVSQVPERGWYNAITLLNQLRPLRGSLLTLTCLSHHPTGEKLLHNVKIDEYQGYHRRATGHSKDEDGGSNRIFLFYVIYRLWTVPATNATMANLSSSCVCNTPEVPFQLTRPLSQISEFRPSTPNYTVRPENGFKLNLDVVAILCPELLSVGCPKQLGPYFTNVFSQGNRYTSEVSPSRKTSSHLPLL